MFEDRFGLPQTTGNAKAQQLQFAAEGGEAKNAIDRARALASGLDPREQDRIAIVAAVPCV